MTEPHDEPRDDGCEPTPGRGRYAHEDHHTSTVAGAAAAERRRAQATGDYDEPYRPDPSEW